jgi:hypothetical protein
MFHFEIPLAVCFRHAGDSLGTLSLLTTIAMG